MVTSPFKGDENANSLSDNLLTISYLTRHHSQQDVFQNLKNKCTQAQDTHSTRQVPTTQIIFVQLKYSHHGVQIQSSGSRNGLLPQHDLLSPRLKRRVPESPLDRPLLSGRPHDCPSRRRHWGRSPYRRPSSYLHERCWESDYQWQGSRCKGWRFDGGPCWDAASVCQHGTDAPDFVHDL